MFSLLKGRQGKLMLAQFSFCTHKDLTLMRGSHGETYLQLCGNTQGYKKLIGYYSIYGGRGIGWRVLKARKKVSTILIEKCVKHGDRFVLQEGLLVFSVDKKITYYVRGQSPNKDHRNTRIRYSRVKYRLSCSRRRPLLISLGKKGGKATISNVHK